jgi:hypothetical protein
MVHFMRNVLARVSPRHTRWAADALKAIFASETRQAALEKAGSIATQMDARKLKEAAKCLREGIGETTTYLLDDYPVEHRRRIRTNTMIRATQPRNTPQNSRLGSVPRRQERTHAHHGEDPLRHRQPVVDPPLPGHVPTARHHTGSELTTHTGDKTQSAQEPGHYRDARMLLAQRPTAVRTIGMNCSRGGRPLTMVSVPGPAPMRAAASG